MEKKKKFWVKTEKIHRTTTHGAFCVPVCPVSQPTDILNSRRTTDILHVVLYLHRLGSGRGEETNDTHVVNDTYCYLQCFFVLRLSHYGCFCAFAFRWEGRYRTVGSAVEVEMVCVRTLVCACVCSLSLCEVSLQFLQVCLCDILSLAKLSSCEASSAT